MHPQKSTAFGGAYFIDGNFGLFRRFEAGPPSV